MKFSAVISSVLLGASYVAAGCAMVDGNYYCAKAKSIKYTNVGYGGSYKDVVSMDEKTGKCEQKEVSFNGNMAPLDEELSVHLRGPLKLHQFAVYYPDGSGVSKREVKEDDCQTVRHKHKRDAAVNVVEMYATVYVDGNGEVIGSKESDGPVKPVTPTSTPTSSADSLSASSSSSASFDSPSSAPSSSPSSACSSASPSSSKGPSSSSASDSAGVGSWRRVAYYKPGSTDNCAFFNHKGGSAGSGTWSAAFGNSISYASSDGVSGAASPSPLGDVTLKSNEELIIFSGAKCDDKSAGDCGYYRENIPAHHGFAGADKIFFFEFTMPSDNGGSGFNYDMPAIWLLNAKIPRTLQYGDATCSCWKSGCGEMDLFEVLSSGSSSLISHVHDGQGSDGASSGGTGSQDYFERPYDTPMKAVVVFHGDKKNVHLVQIDEDLGGSLSADTVSSWMQTEGSVAQMP